jgi:hypothetical protein
LFRLSATTPPQKPTHKSSAGYSLYPAAIHPLNIYLTFLAKGLEEHMAYEGKAFEELH